MSEPSLSLSRDAQRMLLDLAKRAVRAVVLGEPAPTLHAAAIEHGGEGVDANSANAAHDADALRELAGAFVTLHKGGDLRGCIGFTAAKYPLWETVREAAVSAATKDPRFPAVAPGELDELSYEVSVLSPIARCDDLNAIVPGRHGLVVEDRGHVGLLLPQVATEWGWDRETFLSQTCRKAGLPLDAWRKGASVSWFTAEAFDEDDV